MRIGELLKQGQFSISFEFFPPKTAEGEEELFQTIYSLQELAPAFVSVTYGAGGSTRERTKRVVKRIHEETKLTTMAHLTCIAHTKEELFNILKEYREIGIENILALRGDKPTGDFSPPQEACTYAYQLVSFIREHFGGWFSVGVASYPEGHPESPNMDWEVKYFKKKVEAGADFSITQMFFDNRYYYEFVELCQRAGIDVPIIPGIMPITNFRQVQKFASMCGADIPQSLIERLEPYADNPEETLKIGVDFAIGQCLDLMEKGVPGLHFYTLNKSRATLMVYEGIKSAIRL
ncbi:MAG: methylenetetrahydrofolate reductase [NAD(P)H] [Aquificaceae bacterium]|nr:methylenetetrahydrofolate reductase [NAD(P)H] [Aquificaceae bacterium]MCS7195893.1 methylenetetrahydrofolate reductase [NAD(P)H] [Aquificaceae bacterium]MCX7989623.1 methylenetetrahydrofolate reductase [NAD(P)H] [Aquificaceae bacterium]MDW8033086.1 methylenetetrahydrofolate reductase [NAD(P)H] [Aquificaceae bacterium]MDW8294817.1 methylenetetrahydrofolate reductase [NAD(P)H] [Aquificaceae bacterium]